MSLSKQVEVIKNNWLIVLVLLVIVGIPFFSDSNSLSMQLKGGMGAMDMAMEESAMVRSYMPTSGFAPEVESRVITKSASMSSEVKRGQFDPSVTSLKSIITSSNSILLNENINTIDRPSRSYQRGNFQIKIESEKYDSVVGQLKEIGEVQSFSENSDDVTGRYTDLEGELSSEKERLSRFQSMLSKATRVEDQIQLSDRIFDQERRIGYLEDAVENIDNRVSYSSVYLTLSEKQSEYSDLALVKLSEIIKAFVGSLNFAVKTLFIVLPWLVLIWLVKLVMKLKKK